MKLASKEAGKNHKSHFSIRRETKESSEGKIKKLFYFQFSALKKKKKSKRERMKQGACFGEEGNRRSTSRTIYSLVIGKGKKKIKTSPSANLNHYWFQENCTS